MADLKELNDTLKSVSADLTRVSGELREKAEAALAEAKTAGTLSASTKESVDELLTKHNVAAQQVEAITARIDEIDQKMVRGGRSEEATKSLGQRFVDDEAVKAWLAGSPSKGKADLRLKATLTSATTAAAGSVGDAIFPTILAGIQALPQRRLVVRDLITPGRMDTNSLEYVQGDAVHQQRRAGRRSRRQAAVGPRSSTWYTTSAKVIAHWMKASRQVLDDISQLRSIIDQRLLYGLAYVEEASC
jgi:HK97 family phage major capsid protein